MAKLDCPKCYQPVDLTRARIERADGEGVEIVTCPACGRRFYTQRAPLNFIGMWLASLTVSLLTALLGPRPVNEFALVLLAVLIVVPAARALMFGLSS